MIYFGYISSGHSVFRSNATGRNTNSFLRSLCAFSTYENVKTPRRRESSRFAKYIPKRESEMNSLCICTFLKSNFTGSLTFDIGHTSIKLSTDNLMTAE